MKMSLQEAIAMVNRETLLARIVADYELDEAAAVCAVADVLIFGEDSQWAQPVGSAAGAIMWDAIREPMLKFAASMQDFVTKMAEVGQKFVDLAVKIHVGDLVDSHYVMTEHPDLVVADRELDDWYPR